MKKGVTQQTRWNAEHDSEVTNRRVMNIIYQ